MTTSNQEMLAHLKRKAAFSQKELLSHKTLYPREPLVGLFACFLFGSEWLGVGEGFVKTHLRVGDYLTLIVKEMQGGGNGGLAPMIIYLCFKLSHQCNFPHSSFLGNHLR